MCFLWNLDPATQTKCEFCLTYHLDGSDDEQNRSTEESTLLQVVHLLVEASTFYAAVAKGSAAATLLSKPDKDPAVDDYLMIYDLDEKPAVQLADRWPSLPEAVEVTSEEGEQLLAAARYRTVWIDEPQSRRDDRHGTFLYDEAGCAITEKNHLTSQLENTGDLWLVPAIALQDSVDGVHEESHQPSVPMKHRMECWEVIVRLNTASMSSSPYPLRTGVANRFGNAEYVLILATDHCRNRTVDWPNLNLQ